MLAFQLPLSAAAAWGAGASATNWAQEGAWGNMQKQSAGFWDDAIGVKTKKPKQNNRFVVVNISSYQRPRKEFILNWKFHAKIWKEPK